MARLTLLFAFSAVLLGLAVSGCGWVDREEAGVIAEIDGQPIASARFDEYVGETLSGQPGGTDEPPGDELLSRLLDRFLEEELVVREAARRGMEASEQEIAEELSHQESSEGPGGRDAKAASAREAARRAVLLRKFRDEQVLADIQISEEEIARYYDEHRDQFQQTERLVLRQILLDDEGEARRLREELSADPSRFQEVAEEKSLAPDAGRGAAYDEASLPPEVIEAVKDVPEGAVSRVCQGPEGVRLFLVEKREAAREVTREEATDQIRVLLMQERSRVAYEKILEDLRTRAGVVIRSENLPFRYDKQEAGGAGDGSI